ncbi:phage holin family protein [Lachnoclostridium phytofermentans]|uniref:Toxin secretion/phage lysis holin n=1 Tax=Lachnoclostridium phytofermentans (strain ATCC 700394 / DSM 18823 / ISDg) TaxID=357809 RepID=A9KHL3_LACP7|nr:toxin secretion/phage lysis holin [Lachnoclostridium phytofermentans ISDg]
MKDIVTSIQILISSLGGFLGWFLGGTDGFMYALLLFIVIDYLTGVMVAILQHKVSSEVGFRGIFKKVVILCLVGIGHIIDTNVVRSGNVMRTAIIFFYLSNEGISILENVATIGLPIPKKLLDVLVALKSENSNGSLDIKKLEETLESGNSEECKESKKENIGESKEDRLEESKEDKLEEDKEDKLDESKDDKLEESQKDTLEKSRDTNLEEDKNDDSVESKEDSTYKNKKDNMEESQKKNSVVIQKRKM